MGRSVSVPRYAESVVYAAIAPEDDDEWGYDNIKEDLKGSLKAAFPTLEDADGWIGNEDEILLENKVAKVTLSGYGGLVAVAVVPKDPDNALNVKWAASVYKSLEGAVTEVFGSAYKKVGSFSNGEGVYEEVK